MNTHENTPDNTPQACAVIVFDGVCVLCNGWVGFLLRHDRRQRYRFAAMQSPAGRQLLADAGLDPDDPASFLLVEYAYGTAPRLFTDTDAIRRVLVGLGGGWRLAHVLGWLPRQLRDAGYRTIARHRYRLFGQHAACTVPPAEQRHRFL